MRVPFMARWPGSIPAGRGLPRAGHDDRRPPDHRHARRRAAPERPIDGLDIWPLLVGDGGRTLAPRGATLLLRRRAAGPAERPLQAVLPHRSQTLDGPAGSGGIPAKYKRRTSPLALYDLVADVGETTDVAAAHPEVVARLRPSPRRPARTWATR